MSPPAAAVAVDELVGGGWSPRAGGIVRERGPVPLPRRDDRVDDNLRLYRVATGRAPDDPEEYRTAMVAERRLVYVLTPERVYPSSR